MKITFVSESFLPIRGGTEQQFYELAQEFLKRNHKVSVLTTHFNGLASDEDYDGISVRRVGDVDPERYFGARFGRSVRYAVETANLFRQNMMRGDVDCCLYSEFPLFHIMRRPDMPQASVIGVWCESVGGLVGFPQKYMLENLESRALKKCDSIICVNHELQKTLGQKYGARAEYISNGVRFHRFVPTSSEKVITCIGRLVPHKNVELVIRAFEYLDDGWRLEIIGEGRSRSALESLTKSLGLEDHVNFHGTIADERIVEILARTFVLVLPSLREGSSLVALESMAAGVPVITTKTSRLNGAVGEIVIDDYNGLVLGTNDPRDLAKSIMSLEKQTERYHNLSVNARRFARERDWSNIAEKYLAHITQVNQMEEASSLPDVKPLLLNMR